MLELIIIIIIIAAIRKRREKSSAHPAPPIVVPSRNQTGPISKTALNRQVNQRFFGTEDLKDRVAVYNRLLLTDRYQNMEKIAHELGISKQQVLREIQNLKAQGHYTDITIDPKNYRLIYPAHSKTPSVRKPKRNTPKTSASRKTQTNHTFVQPSKPYHPARNAAERYEEWIPLASEKEVIRCSYCGAENQIPKGTRPGQFTCYFCREEL